LPADVSKRGVLVGALSSRPKRAIFIIPYFARFIGVNDWVFAQFLGTVWPQVDVSNMLIDYQ